MIDRAIRWIVAHAWRAVINRPRWQSGKREAWVEEWRADNPGRCLYCSYTEWVRKEHGQHLKIGEHLCVEGNGRVPVLPVARTTRTRIQ